MSAQTILVVPDSAESVGACLDAASGAAAALAGPRIELLHIRLDPSGIVQWPDVLTPGYEAAVNARSDTEGAAIRAAFDAWCAANPAAAVDWTEITAVPAAAIRARRGDADLLVLPRPARTAHPAVTAGFDAALFEADRPVLVVPPGAGGRFGRHLAVGWRDTRDTRRSLEHLRPWLMSAGAVSLIAVGDGSASLPADWAAANLPAGVRLHAVPPEGRSNGEALLTAAMALGADGLAMGAYRHGRLVERMLGGVTADILRNAQIPVLMQV
jgi:nucleotide-binding universal stress UspA family protein